MTKHLTKPTKNYWVDAVRLRRNLEDINLTLTEQLMNVGAFVTIDKGLIKEAKKNKFKVEKQSVYIIYTQPV